MDEAKSADAKPVLADLAPSTARKHLGLLKSSLSPQILSKKLESLPSQSFFSPPHACNMEVSKQMNICISVPPLNLNIAGKGIHISYFG